MCRSVKRAIPSVGGGGCLLVVPGIYIVGEEGLKSSLACPRGSKCKVQGTYARLASSQAGFPLALSQNRTFEAESMGDHDMCDLTGLAHPLECLSLSGCGLANPQPKRESDMYSSPAYLLPSPIQLSLVSPRPVH